MINKDEKVTLMTRLLQINAIVSFRKRPFMTRLWADNVILSLSNSIHDIAQTDQCYCKSEKVIFMKALWQINVIVSLRK